MYPSEISGVIVSSEEFGCAYTVCTEGELFYAPIHENGDVSVMEFDFVDFDTMDEETAEKVERIHSALIDICLLYTSPSPRDISGSRMPSSA